jgi:hypothetical protein
MSLKQAIHHNIVNNPIVRLEATTLRRQRGKWFQWFAYLVTAILLFAPLFWGYSSQFFHAINTDLTFLVIFNAIVYLVVVLKSVATANDSTYRERRGKTWELLMLTGVSNWRVVFGKWLGVMKSLLRDYLWLYTIRIGTLLWFVVQQNLYRSFDGCLYGYGWSDCATPTLADVNFGHQFLLHACLLMLGFSVLELMASTAIGMSTAFFNWKAQTANGAAMLIRIGLGAGLPMLVYFILFQIEWNNPGWMMRNISPEMGMFGARLVTIFGDNGMIGSALVFDNYTMETYRQIFWASNWVSMGFYALVTILALQLAATRAFFGGVSLATDSIPEVKVKRVIEAAPFPRPLPSSQAHPSRLYNEHGQANVFGIKGAALRLMEIYHYQRRLGRMILRVTGEGEPMYIQLDNVIYMEAPAFWKGANLNSATESEFRVFLNEKKLAVSSIAEDTMRLYWNEAGVRIVAGSAEVLEELPAYV